jgi:glycerol-3-phosphate dehydrogenase (NAD(P)+)
VRRAFGLPSARARSTSVRRRREIMSIRFTVLGAGSWGTTLAIRLSGSGHAVRLWGHDPARTRALAASRENAAYLPGHRLPDGVEVHTALEDALAGAESVVLCVPRSARAASSRRRAACIPPARRSSSPRRGSRRGRCAS